MSLGELKDLILKKPKFESRLYKLLEMQKSNFSNALDKEIDNEVNAAEQEIINLKNASSEKIKNIAIETSSELIKQLIGEEANNSSISAIVEDQSRKIEEKQNGV